MRGGEKESAQLASYSVELRQSADCAELFQSMSNCPQEA